MTRYHTVIFDLDGTLADTLGDLHTAVNYALAGFSMPLRTKEETRAAVGNGIRNLIFRSLPAETPDSVADAILSAFKTYYAEHLLEQTRPYNGIPALLAQLQRAGVRTAVATNKFDAGAKQICSVLFGGLIDIVRGEEESCPRKPSPEIIGKILSDLGSEIEGTLLVGDSGVDAETAGNAGIDFLAVTWGFRTKEQLAEAGAVCFAESAEDIARFVLGEGVDM